MHGKSVCYHHGGKSRNGAASGMYKHGRYSKNLPTRLAAQYEASEQDGDLLNLRQEIALTDTRLSDLLTRVDTGESGALWKELGALGDDLRKAYLDGDGKKLARCLNDLELIVSRGFSDFAAWSEIASLIEQRRRLVDSEAKRLKDMQMMVSADRAMLLIGALVSILRQRIEDRGILDDILRDIDAIIARRDVAEIEG